jgi:hypothetical protein
MLDVSVSYERYKFLGHEFLTWLWFLIEKDQEKLRQTDENLTSLEIGNRMVLENRLNESVEILTIKGDDAGLEEGMLALKKGAAVTEMNLVYKSGGYEWRFSIKGESFNIGNLKPPETAPVEAESDNEAAVLEKIYLYEKVFNLMDNIYRYFIRIRISDEWNSITVPRLKNWIQA